MDIGDLDARISELETRFRKLGLLKPTAARDDGGTGGCTHGCTGDCPEPTGDCTYDCTYGCTTGCTDAGCFQAEDPKRSVETAHDAAATKPKRKSKPST